LIFSRMDTVLEEGNFFGPLKIWYLEHT